MLDRLPELKAFKYDFALTGETFTVMHRDGRLIKKLYNQCLHLELEAELKEELERIRHTN